VNVDTGEFRDLAQRVAELEKRIVDVTRLHELVLGAELNRNPGADLPRRDRHLKAVE
jgi:hypothetical protein